MVSNQHQVMKSTASFGLNQFNKNSSNYKVTNSIHQQQQSGRNQGQLEHKQLMQNKSCLVGKENMCNNQDGKGATGEFIKNGM